MAYLKSPFGKFSGAIGNLVFRSTSKGNIVAAAPATYTSPTDEATMTRRTKFSFVIKFSAALIRLASLSIFWKSATPVSGKRRITKVFKNVYPQVDTLSITGIDLVKDPDISVNPEVNLTPGNLQCIIQALGANQNIDTAVEKTIGMEAVIQLSDPVDVASPAFAFIPVFSSEVALLLTDPLTFNASLTGSKLLLAQKYTTMKAALVLVTKDIDGNPVKYSETVFS